MTDLAEFIAESLVVLDPEASDYEATLATVLRRCVREEVLTETQRTEVLKELLKRERETSTAIGDGVAVPHGYFDFLDQQIVVITRLAEPLAKKGPDGVPVRYVFTLLGPMGQAAEHLETLMHIARLMSEDTCRFEIGEARDEEQFREAFRNFDKRVAEREEDGADEAENDDIDPELRRTGRMGGGIVADIKRRVPSYKQDFIDGFHPKALGSTLFLFFACVAPAITFGGFMASVTGGAIGAVEMLVATAIGGVIYAFLSGQPLTILGGTGPLLVLTEVLFLLCARFDLPFLPVYAWVGLWTALFTILLALTDLSSLIRYFTRFTDEIFAALISLIFIVEALQKLLSHGDHTPTESVLLSLLLGLGTFYVATSLSRFRKSRFLHSRIREFLADFGASIAVASMTAMAYFLFKDVSLESLAVPDEFSTTSGRAWTIDIMALPKWAIFASIGPAIVTTILIYLDQNITARLINNKDHKLKRGAGYHLDLAIVGALVGAFSLFGLPWLVAATVRSLNHVRSLATTEEVVLGTGDKKDRIIQVRENRITGLAIHVLIGASLLLLPYLKVIPMPVLYGLFLFMGVVSMSGNQLFERLSLWLMDRKRYPSSHYMRRVPNGQIHKFTLLQTICLAILWILKTSALAILFPLFIALMVPIRMFAGRWFKPEHLHALDAEEEPEEESGTEPHA